MIMVTGATLTTVMKGSPVVELPLVVALVCGVWLRSVSLDGAGAVSQVSVTDVSPDFIQHPNWTLLQWWRAALHNWLETALAAARH